MNNPPNKTRDAAYLAYWWEALRLQVDRALGEHANFLAREIDVDLVAHVLRNFVRAVRFVRVHAPSKIDSGLSRFFAEVPDVIVIRDIFEHFDEYARGVGKLQKQGRFEDPSGWYEGHGRTYRVLVAGGLFELDVAGAYAAAERLLDDVDAALYPNQHNT